MNSQTARRPDNQRPARSAKARKYVRQTAHVEARRDGKPLIFGWGGHLSRNEKIRLQQRAIWTLTVVVAVVIVAVIVGFWVNINVIVPNLAISSVNGHNIPQSDYRKLVALEAQRELNKVNDIQLQSITLQKQVADQQSIIDTTTKTITSLNTQIKALPAGPSQKRTDLENQLTTAKSTLAAAQAKHTTLNASYQNITTNTLPQEKNLYNQSQVGNDSVQWLQEDQLIRQWSAKQSASIQSQIEPTASAITHYINDFTAHLPKGTTYSKFLGDNRLSDDDVHAMTTLLVRRQNMQGYLSSLITSPAYQIKARAIAVATMTDANNVLKQLKQGSDFATLAKSKISLDDATTKNNGGELGWLAHYQYAKVYGQNVAGSVDNWLFNTTHTVHEYSPVLSENGTFHILQIEDINASRAIDATTLKSLKDNALTAWILSQKALPGVTVTSADSSMLLDASNMPASLPSGVQSGSSSGGSTLPTGQ